MRVSLDGGVTWLEAPEGVRVDLDDDSPDSAFTMTVNFTHEGVIVDQWGSRKNDECCLNTAAILYDDLPDFFFGRS